MKYLVSSY